MNDLRFWTQDRSVDVVFDVGANVGQTVDRFKRYFPEARIEAFEPVRSTFETLQDRVADYEEVRCHPFALGKTADTKQIRLVPNSLINSLSNEVSGPSETEETEEISVRTLDSFCEQENIRHIDVLKTDTEGFDVDVLKGGKDLLERHGVDFIISESAFHPSDDQHTLFRSLNNYLQEAGYRVAGFYEIARERERPAVSYCNVCYARKGVLSQG